METQKFIEIAAKAFDLVVTDSIKSSKLGLQFIIKLESLLEEAESYKQLCVWPGTLVTKPYDTQEEASEQIKKFETFISDNFNGTRVIYAEEIRTLPGDGGEGGRNDLFFHVHRDDISKFAVARLQFGIRWWEDVLSNGNGKLYSAEFLAKYPKTW